jgi:hypothetical protein
MCCPRDGQPDCSIVDALQAQSKSAKATWFLSWVWGYKFSTVYKALDFGDTTVDTAFCNQLMVIVLDRTPHIL